VTSGRRQLRCPCSRLMMGFSSKWRGDRGGAHLGELTARWAAVAAYGGQATSSGSGFDGGSLRWTSGSQNSVAKLRCTPLALLLPSIVVSGDEKWRATAAARVNCRTKFKRFRPLFIGVLVLTCRGCGVLHFLSINQNRVHSDTVNRTRG
jgi:hypothetical protein